MRLVNDISKYFFPHNFDLNGSTQDPLNTISTIGDTTVENEMFQRGFGKHLRVAEALEHWICSWTRRRTQHLNSEGVWGIAPENFNDHALYALGKWGKRPFQLHFAS